MVSTWWGSPGKYNYSGSYATRNHKIKARSVWTLWYNCISTTGYFDDLRHSCHWGGEKRELSSYVGTIEEVRSELRRRVCRVCVWKTLVGCINTRESLPRRSVPSRVRNDTSLCTPQTTAGSGWEKRKIVFKAMNLDKLGRIACKLEEYNIYRK